jgi:hypothetical protein|tara:strand:+ start:448 stop:633 length:186 start_codon:yes stop_codon:yes gene_type:complete
LKYKAKASYKGLDDTENFNAHGSASKHLWLLEGLEVEIKNVPKNIKEHLTEVKNTTKGGKK